MSAPSPASGRGATPVGGQDKRKPWWLVLLLLLVAAIILLIVLAQCSDDSSDNTNSPDRTQTPSPSSSAPTEPAGTGPGSSDPSGTASSPTTGTTGAAGSLTAGGKDLLPLAGSATADGDLSALDGQGVEAASVTVLAVPADEGFWVGTSDTERVWVELTTSNESPYQVKAGDVVDFSGTITTHDTDYASQVGVEAAEGADLLTSQKAHIVVEAGAVTLSQS